MSTPATNSTSVLGIDNTLSGFTILTENVEENDVSIKIPDQQGATVEEHNVDIEYNLTLEFYGSGTLPTVGDTGLTYGGEKWKVDKVAKVGNYNDFQKYNLTAHRSKHYPSST